MPLKQAPQTSDHSSASYDVSFGNKTVKVATWNIMTRGAKLQTGAINNGFGIIEDEQSYKQRLSGPIASEVKALADKNDVVLLQEAPKDPGEAQEFFDSLKLNSADWGFKYQRTAGTSSGLMTLYKKSAVGHPSSSKSVLGDRAMRLSFTDKDSKITFGVTNIHADRSLDNEDIEKHMQAAGGHTNAELMLGDFNNNNGHFSGLSTYQNAKATSFAFSPQSNTQNFYANSLGKNEYKNYDGIIIYNNSNQPINLVMHPVNTFELENGQLMVNTPDSNSSDNSMSIPPGTYSNQGLAKFNNHLDDLSQQQALEATGNKSISEQSNSKSGAAKTLPTNQQAQELANQKSPNKQTSRPNNANFDAINKLANKHKQALQNATTEKNLAVAVENKGKEMFAGLTKNAAQIGKATKGKIGADIASSPESFRKNLQGLETEKKNAEMLLQQAKDPRLQKNLDIYIKWLGKYIENVQQVEGHKEKAAAAEREAEKAENDRKQELNRLAKEGKIHQNRNATSEEVDEHLKVYFNGYEIAKAKYKKDENGKTYAEYTNSSGKIVTKRYGRFDLDAIRRDEGSFTFETIDKNGHPLSFSVKSPLVDNNGRVVTDKSGNPVFEVLVVENGVVIEYTSPGPKVGHSMIRTDWINSKMAEQSKSSGIKLVEDRDHSKGNGPEGNSKKKPVAPILSEEGGNLDPQELQKPRDTNTAEQWHTEQPEAKQARLNAAYEKLNTAKSQQQGSVSNLNQQATQQQPSYQNAKKPSNFTEEEKSNKKAPSVSSPEDHDLAKGITDLSDKLKGAFAIKENEAASTDKGKEELKPVNLVQQKQPEMFQAKAVPSPEDRQNQNVASKGKLRDAFKKLTSQQKNDTASNARDVKEITNSKTTSKETKSEINPVEGTKSQKFIKTAGIDPKKITDLFVKAGNSPEKAEANTKAAVALGQDLSDKGVRMLEDAVQNVNKALRSLEQRAAVGKNTPTPAA